MSNGQIFDAWDILADYAKRVCLQYELMYSETGEIGEIVDKAFVAVTGGTSATYTIDNPAGYDNYWDVDRAKQYIHVEIRKIAGYQMHHNLPVI